MGYPFAKNSITLWFVSIAHTLAFGCWTTVGTTFSVQDVHLSLQKIGNSQLALIKSRHHSAHNDNDRVCFCTQLLTHCT